MVILFFTRKEQVLMWFHKKHGQCQHCCGLHTIKITQTNNNKQQERFVLLPC